jgi:hypothetical protein
MGSTELGSDEGGDSGYRHDEKTYSFAKQHSVSSKKTKPLIKTTSNVHMQGWAQWR